MSAEPFAWEKRRVEDLGGTAVAREPSRSIETRQPHAEQEKLICCRGLISPTFTTRRLSQAGHWMMLPMLGIAVKAAVKNLVPRLGEALEG